MEQAREREEGAKRERESARASDRPTDRCKMGTFSDLPASRLNFRNPEESLIPSGKQPHNYGKSPGLLGKSMKIHYFDWVIFNSKL
jgi:hypothetical protein